METRPPRQVRFKGHQSHDRLPCPASSSSFLAAVSFEPRLQAFAPPPNAARRTRSLGPIRRPRLFPWVRIPSGHPPARLDSSLDVGSELAVDGVMQDGTDAVHTATSSPNL
ncbi:hypothetical protein EJB05_20739, partial [Eragrostis curvula]